MSTYANLKSTRDKDGEKEFSAEIPLDILLQYEKQELVHFGRDVVVPGFRKGNVPEHILRERVNPTALFEEAAESALREAVREIAIAQKLHVLGVPRLAVKELAPQKPVHFTVRFAVMPKIDLPDYKKIGRDILTRKDSIMVSDEELHNAETHIRRMMKRTDESKNATEGEKNETQDEKEEALPELTDEAAQKLGHFASVEELRKMLKEDLMKEKERTARDAKRDEVIQGIMKHTKVTVPSLLIDEEYERFMEDRTKELERMGTSLDAYLMEIKKSEKDLEREDRGAIERELKTSLTFRVIRDKEGIFAEDKEIAANVAFLKNRYPNQDPGSFRRTAEAYIVQEKIFELFELKDSAMKTQDLSKE